MYHIVITHWKRETATDIAHGRETVLTSQYLGGATHAARGVLASAHSEIRMDPDLVGVSVAIHPEPASPAALSWPPALFHVTCCGTSTRIYRRDHCLA